jgi:hypothetical protein
VAPPPLSTPVLWATSRSQWEAGIKICDHVPAASSFDASAASSSAGGRASGLGRYTHGGAAAAWHHHRAPTEAASAADDGPEAQRRQIDDVARWAQLATRVLEVHLVTTTRRISIWSLNH